MRISMQSDCEPSGHVIATGNETRTSTPNGKRAATVRSLSRNPKTQTNSAGCSKQSSRARVLLGVVFSHLDGPCVFSHNARHTATEPRIATASGGEAAER